MDILRNGSVACPGRHSKYRSSPPPTMIEVGANATRHALIHRFHIVVSRIVCIGGFVLLGHCEVLIANIALILLAPSYALLAICSICHLNLPQQMLVDTSTK
ncbi:hypothetical protein V1508DRAFT_425976 [Lipomyces doorenjongii]|uniref:uncharacterized protein n=1 Tax=Lipomyces doorenjongii TaxID=383834 RepID=UPI0034CF15E3